MKSSSLRLAICSLAVISFLPTAAWAADDVVGALTRTYVIVEDTDLIGDVACDVGSSPCFSFGASGVELRLNGFRITGKADPVTGCGGANSPNEFGITTNGHHYVTVRGPGSLERFRNFGCRRDGRLAKRTHRGHHRLDQLHGWDSSDGRGVRHARGGQHGRSQRLHRARGRVRRHMSERPKQPGPAEQSSR